MEEILSCQSLKGWTGFGEGEDWGAPGGSQGRGSDHELACFWTREEQSQEQRVEMAEKHD